MESAPFHSLSDQDNRGRWWEDTSKLAQEPELPEDSTDDAFLETAEDFFRGEPGKAFLRILERFARLRAMQMFDCLLHFPDPRAKAFVWKYLQGHSDREIARRLGVDHKTAASWCREVARALLNPHRGVKHQGETVNDGR